MTSSDRRCHHAGEATEPRGPHAATYSASVTLPNRIESVRPAVAFLTHAARSVNIPAAWTALFEIAVAEAVTNAVRHGSANRLDGSIQCDIEVDPHELRIRVVDDGPGFVIHERRLPEFTPDDVDTLPERGYGLPIIQTAFPTVRAVRVDGRFAVELVLPRR